MLKRYYSRCVNGSFVDVYVFHIVHWNFIIPFVYRYISSKIMFLCGPSSSVGIATNYGLDGPGSNTGGDEVSRPSRPALGPT